MDNKTAAALALALAAGVAAIGAVPSAWALSGNCDADFPIAASEILAEERDLLAGASEVGGTSVVMGVPKTLNVELVDAGAAGELTWLVFHETTACVQYTEGGCSDDNVLTEDEQRASCTLNAPSSKPYWVLFEETSDANAIVYKVWTS